ncbi:hypothetical protein, partial [Nonomuraea sp. SBT364]|uniref:hypothetical protein n=1 Tax=Nonomuraea sp. SBT364 TaxID=1580530 RepID=UPI00066AFB15
PVEPLVIPTPAPSPFTPPAEAIVIAAAGPVEPIVIPAATSPFDAFARTPERTRTPDTIGEFARPAPMAGAAHAVDTTAEMFDAFARPTVRRDGYSGRRRRYEHPIEEPGFAADAPPRGRRHRSGGLAPQYLEPFTQDAPLRGRRHRTAAQQARTAAHQQMALTGPPQRQSSEDTAPSRARRTSTQRRGRHRA